MELLRDRRAEFDAAGVQPVGISRDSPWTHIAWTQALDLNFGLLSDWNAEAIHGFGVASTFRALRDVAERSAFLIDDSGTIRNVWKYESSEVPDVDEWLDACRALSLSNAPSSGVDDVHRT
jgi:peroxiredoxin